MGFNDVEGHGYRRCATRWSWRVQTLDLLALHARLEGEVEVAERLHGGQARGAHRSFESTTIAERDLRAHQRLDGGGRRQRPAVEARQDRIEVLEGAGHLQVGALLRPSCR